jgi:HSP20 family protein
MGALVRQRPFPELESMERRLRRLLESPLTPFMPTVVPAADIYETEKEYIVELEVPGFTEKELSIEVADHTLTVSGAREAEQQETEKAYRLQERLERTFEREFRLPPEADEERVTAHFEHGLLEVHAPKATIAARHKVEILT